MTEFNAPLSVEEVTPARSGRAQALVRIAASGLCHTDLLFWQGYSPVEPPIVLGHEGAGVVEEVGPEVRTVAPGDRVVCTWMTACGVCWFCVRGESRLCEELAGQRGERRLTRGDGSAAVGMLGVGSFADHAARRRARAREGADRPARRAARAHRLRRDHRRGRRAQHRAVASGLDRGGTRLRGRGPVGGPGRADRRRDADRRRRHCALKRETALALGATDASIRARPTRSRRCAR